MKLTDLTKEQLVVAHRELVLARSALVSRAYGELEQYNIDRAFLLDYVIRFLRDAIVMLEGDSDGI